MVESNGSAVVIQNVCFAFRGGPDVLCGVNLTVSAGERAAIVGPNGAGKSTLLRHLVGLLRQRTGTIRVMGLDVTPATYARVRRNIGYVFQDSDDQLFSPTVAEDVAFGPLHLGLDPGELADRVKRALEAVNLPGFGHRVPHQLSEGEKRRAAIATVLSYDPQILVLDEPSADQDPQNRRRLIELLRGHAGTLLIATHDLDLAWELCDRTILLRDGCVVAEGPTRQVLANRDLLQQNDLDLPLRLQPLVDASWPPVASAPDPLDP
jgi:energy-coupling factor transporter ATP-binding protein EcfA2